MRALWRRVGAPGDADLCVSVEGELLRRPSEGALLRGGGLLDSRLPGRPDAGPAWRGGLPRARGAGTGWRRGACSSILRGLLMGGACEAELS